MGVFSPHATAREAVQPDGSQHTSSNDMLLVQIAAREVVQPDGRSKLATAIVFPQQTAAHDAVQPDGPQQTRTYECVIATDYRP